MVAGGKARQRVHSSCHCDPLAAYAYRWFGGLTTTSNRSSVWLVLSHLRRLDKMFDLVVCANSHLALRLRRGGLGKVETIAMGVELGIFPRRYAHRLAGPIPVRSACGRAPSADRSRAASR
jgi:hypothetical protein